MKLKIRVKNARDEWWEDYDCNLSPGTEKTWAGQLIASFNSSLRSGELPRELLEVQVVSEANTKHEWVKLTAGMSIPGPGGTVDLFQCRRCGITGKRRGLDSTIVRDSKFRAKKYEKCKGGCYD